MSIVLIVFVKNENESLFNDQPNNQRLHLPITRRDSTSRGTGSPNSLTDFSKHSCSRLPMKAPKFLMGLVATRLL